MAGWGCVAAAGYQLRLQSMAIGNCWWLIGLCSPCRLALWDGIDTGAFLLHLSVCFHKSYSKSFPSGLWISVKFGRDWQGGFRGGLTAVPTSCPECVHCTVCTVS